VLNSRTQRTERIGRLLKMHANKREDISEILAGDILRGGGLEECQYRRQPSVTRSTHHAGVDHLCGSGDFGCCRTQDQGRSGKMGLALAKLAQEDPTFKSHRPRQRTDHHQRMGELHLEIIVDRMMREYKVEANVGKPQVPTAKPFASTPSGRQIHSPDWRPRPVRARENLSRSATAGDWIRIRERHRGRFGAQGIHQAIDQGIRERSRRLLAGYPMWM